LFNASTALSEWWTFAQDTVLHLSASAQNSPNLLSILFTESVGLVNRALPNIINHQ